MFKFLVGHVYSSIEHITFWVPLSKDNFASHNVGTLVNDLKKLPDSSISNIILGITVGIHIVNRYLM